MSISEPHLFMTNKHNTTPDLPVSVMLWWPWQIQWFLVVSDIHLQWY